MTIRSTMFALAGLCGCGLGATSSELSYGSAQVVALGSDGNPAANANVLVHDGAGEIVRRVRTAADGTATVELDGGSMVTVIIQSQRSADPDAALVEGDTLIRSFVDVPAGATIRIGHPVVPEPGEDEFGILMVQLPEPPAGPNATYSVGSAGCGSGFAKSPNPIK